VLLAGVDVAHAVALVPEGRGIHAHQSAPVTAFALVLRLWDTAQQDGMLHAINAAVSGDLAQVVNRNTLRQSPPRPGMRPFKSYMTPSR
jgi:hypothetical protein